MPNLNFFLAQAKALIICISLTVGLTACEKPNPIVELNQRIDTGDINSALEIIESTSTRDLKASEYPLGRDEEKPKIQYVPIVLAVERSQKGIVVALLKKGLDPDETIVWGPLKDKSAAVIASQKHDFTLLEVLLRSGANVTDVIADATHASNTTTLDFVRNLGVSLNSTGFIEGTPLIIAATEGNVAMARYLLDRGADPNIVCDTIDCRNETALSSAIRNKKSEIVALLIQYGATDSFPNE